MEISTIIKSLQHAHIPQDITYHIPEQWTGEGNGYKSVHPSQYLIERIESILSKPRQTIQKTPDWSKDAVIYNLFVRTACAIDHDKDGIIGGSKNDVTLNSQGMRETGTFLKAIAMLEYIQNLGCNTVYLLPITTIGMASRKGALGSPYAIKNPFNIDENLGDPLLADISIDDQFAAFTNLAHHLGMRVVLEFVFRTSSLDGDWVKDHPQWYYWIKDEIGDRSPECPQGYGNPAFGKDALTLIKRAGEEGGSGLVRTPQEVKKALERGEGKLIEPGDDYQKIFTDIPESVKMTGAKWTGTLKSGQKVRIPGAFADWPPDDVQPPWTDVTYLRMYGKASEQFNYVAYNTIRLYDPRLAIEEKINTELWNTISSIIPSYQKRFKIDGVMVDMGHALPVDLAFQIQKEAKKNDESFAFWEEKFFLDPVSPQTGYEAVVGPGIFVLGDFYSCKQYLYNLTSTPARFFATGENHNTPRLSRRSTPSWSKAAWTVAAMLPGAIPFIHNGMELYESTPLNTGLCFREEDIAELKDIPLGLFDAAGFNWNTESTMTPWIKAVSEVKKEYSHILSSTETESFEVIHSLPDHALGFFRKANGKRKFAVIVNAGHEAIEITPEQKWRCLSSGIECDGPVAINGGTVEVMIAV